MPLAGLLDVIEVPNLLQVLCQARRRVAVVVEAGDHHGTFFLESGQIVHARTGDLVGEAAAYEIMSWNTGDFRVLESTPVPQRTIRSNPVQLLIKAANRAGGLSLPPTPSEEASVLAAYPEDEAWEAELLSLLSRMERGATHLASHEVCRDPILALEVMEGLINSIEIFANEEELWPEGSRLGLRVQLLEEPSPLLRLATMEGPHLRLGSVAKHYCSLAGDEDVRCHAYVQLCGSLIEILDGQLQELAMRFIGDSAHKEWDEVCGVFLDQVRDAVAEIRF